MTNPAELPESLDAAAPSAPSPRRRRLLYAGVAGAAALGGAGLAWWKFQPHAMEPGAEQALWSMEFDQPDGGALALKSFAGKPLLLNFWATWCPPCVEELPMLNAFYREHAAKGWQVLGLAIDQPSAVRKFLARIPLEFPVGLAGLGGTDLGRSLGNLTGGLPFTVVLGAEGRVLHRKMGQVTPQDLTLWSALR
ncbi:MAG: TlpA family protein disulfide reductase [Gammaproteobacteria bacterium]|nr:TlpA family protein disulfide reductase [Gammaproteobacteria bacterium]MBU0830054.1 TlpA family protein disulfide reductase [Gammaproteobacteria bacterium]MBU0892420.1 TlpA family protein disulfide reductase [Gammaproteobacteria bacterium]MBU1818181.1 TlpA family protein disulfide reductase [Gammaproteobacteria bacterium]